MSNRELVDQALALGRTATMTLKTWTTHPYTSAGRAKTAWGKAIALLDQVSDPPPAAASWPPAGQIKLEVPIIDRYRRDQATRSLTPAFFMIVDWVEHPYRFEVDGVPIGTFTSHDGGSDGSTVEGHMPALYPGLHVIQGFEDVHGTVSVPVTFLVDPVNGPPV